jgi:excisionase family DNA binding protein
MQAPQDQPIMINTLPPPPMSPREVAEYLGVSIAVVYRLIRANKLAAVKIGGQYRISPAAVQRLLENIIDV